MRGTVVCEEADVAGSFEGVEMTIHHRLTLSGTARVGGKVRRRVTAIGSSPRRVSVHHPSARDGCQRSLLKAAKERWFEVKKKCCRGETLFKALYHKGHPALFRV